MDRKVEILSPAGSYESLKAAIAAGADAVYVGGMRFGARAFADNLSEDALLEAIDYVHLHGRKIYLTINTLLKERELKNELYSYLLPFYKQGLDAVIVQDIGVLQYIREQFPDLPIHASTQMTVTNLLGAKFLEELGVSRVVTARELQLDEVKEIAEHTNLEVESFVHGALCYCYSGQCLYSSLLGGRSGNRGQCAQPCRLPYRVAGSRKSRYLLSLKDICTLEYIPELVESGIDSFKIEGRMKKPEYVALVTAMYRKYVDLYLEKGRSGFRIDPKDEEKLLDLYNRGGSCKGYYHTENGRDMLSLERPNHAGVPALKVLSQNGKQITARALTEIRKGDVIELPDENENYTFAHDVNAEKTVTFVAHKKQVLAKNQVLNRIRNASLLNEIKTTITERNIKEKVNGKLILSSKDSARLILTCKKITAEAIGERPQEAVNRPLQSEQIARQMRKTGSAPFEFDELQIDIQGNLFMTVQSLNELRRNALKALEEKIVSTYRRSERPKLEDRYEDLTKASAVGRKLPLYLYVEQIEQWEEALLVNEAERIYLDCNAIDEIWKNPCVQEFVERTHKSGKEIYLGMPHIFRSKTIQKYESGYAHIFGAGFDGMLIRNYESYEFLRKHLYPGNIVTDYNLYQFNRKAKQFWEQKCVESTTAPLELNEKELADVGLENSEFVAYGHLPMMISAQCVKKNTDGCQKEKGRLAMEDRYRKNFTVKQHCDYCYNIIYNTAPVVLTDQKESVLALKPKALRMHFTVEDRKAMKKMLHLYCKIFCRDAQGQEPDVEFTRGHFKRGIR